METKRQTTPTMNIEIWIGLVGVIPKVGNISLEKGVGGAYVNVLCYARGFEEFQERIKSELDKLDFEIFEIEDAEPFFNRVHNYEVNKTLCELAYKVNRTKEIRYGTFHTFPHKGVN